MIRKEFEYRRNAILSVELARRAASPADKAYLLKLAEAWLDLAHGSRRPPRHSRPPPRQYGGASHNRGEAGGTKSTGSVRRPVLPRPGCVQPRRLCCCG